MFEKAHKCAIAYAVLVRVLTAGTITVLVGACGVKIDKELSMFSGHRFSQASHTGFFRLDLCLTGFSQLPLQGPHFPSKVSDNA